MVSHTYNPNTKKENLGFENNLGYIVKCHLEYVERPFKGAREMV